MPLIPKKKCCCGELDDEDDPPCLGLSGNVPNATGRYSKSWSVSVTMNAYQFYGVLPADSSGCVTPSFTRTQQLTGQGTCAGLVTHPGSISANMSGKIYRQSYTAGLNCDASMPVPVRHATGYIADLTENDGSNATLFFGYFCYMQNFYLYGRKTAGQRSSYIDMSLEIANPDDGDPHPGITYQIDYRKSYGFGYFDLQFKDAEQTFPNDTNGVCGGDATVRSRGIILFEGTLSGNISTGTVTYAPVAAWTTFANYVGPQCTGYLGADHPGTVLSTPQCTSFVFPLDVDQWDDECD